MTTAALVLEVARRAAELLASDDVRRNWHRPSALDGYDVGGLAGHLARAVLTLQTYVEAAEAPAKWAATDAAGYYVAVLGDHHPVHSQFHVDVRRRGAEAAADRLVELVVHLDDLAVSVGRPEPDVPEPALRVVAGVLGEVAAARAGGLQAVRGLARPERHPEAVRAL